MRKPLLLVDNVTLKANERWYFEGTHWRIHNDEQWAMIGPTGAGKSLLVSALCRHITVVHGQIRFFFDDTPDGRSYFRRGEIVLVSAETQRELLQKYIGYHQARWQSTEGEEAPAVAELLSRQSIEYISPYEVTPPRVDEADYAARRAQVAQLLGIDYLLGRKIIHLSNGEARKVLLARALMQSPRLLILDDPFGGLDDASRKTLARVLDDILSRGQQRLLLVTSRGEEIPDGITHVLGVKDCRVAMQGPKAEVLSAPFAQQLLGAPLRVEQKVRPLPVAHWEASEPGTALIELNHVHVSYHGVPILCDVTWTMRQGERWAIRGPNGAGKSTLLSLILGDNPQAYANDLKLFGQQRGSGESIWDIKRHIGWVAPELHVYYESDCTCQRVVCSGFFDSVGVYQTVTPAQGRQAVAWMDALGIEALAQKSFQDISMGEQRLVLFARALVKQPRLLILDEPCQGLDMPHRTRMINILETLCRQTPVSLLYVTHHADELPEVVTHVLEVAQGRARVRRSPDRLSETRKVI